MGTIMGKFNQSNKKCGSVAFSDVPESYLSSQSQKLFDSKSSQRRQKLFLFKLLFVQIESQKRVESFRVTGFQAQVK